MYGVVRTSKFERAFRKLKRSGLMSAALRDEVDEVIFKLATNQKLPTKYRDHKLVGSLGAYRECHIRGDLLLVYEKQDDKLILVLLNIGSHSYLFGS